MTEFLTEAQRRALEKVIAKARSEPGMHRELAPDGEAYAYRFGDEINWGVNGGPLDANLARGVVPLKRQ